MTLNKPSGNMYPWAYTWNPEAGECPYGCSYCYVRDLRKRGIQKYFGQPRLDEKAFKDRLIVPEGYIVFVQSCGDLFGSWVPDSWIQRILDYLKKFPQTTFLLQTKNPKRYFYFKFPLNCILGTTIETNRNINDFSKAPTPKERYQAFRTLRMGSLETLMISIEPVIDFDLYVFYEWIREIQPKFISIGADSGKNNLPEPPAQKIGELIALLRTFTEVRVKKNIQRLLNQK